MESSYDHPKPDSVLWIWVCLEPPCLPLFAEQADNAEPDRPLVLQPCSGTASVPNRYVLPLCMFEQGPSLGASRFLAARRKAVPLLPRCAIEAYLQLECQLSQLSGSRLDRCRLHARQCQVGSLLERKALDFPRSRGQRAHTIPHACDAAGTTKRDISTFQPGPRAQVPWRHRP